MTHKFITKALVIFACMQPLLTQSAASSSSAAPSKKVLSGYAWGVSERQGKRPSMEDAYAADISTTSAFFGIFDGHGGDEAAKKTAILLPILTQRIPLMEPGSPSTKAYEELDELFQKQKERSGTTAVSVYIQKNDDPESSSPYILEVAWTGDSRAIYVRKNGSIAFETTDHKPTEELEQKRIQDAGGLVMFGRVVSEESDKSLAVTRAIGDYNLKQETKGIIATPEVRKLKVFDRHHFMILACDGVWDVIKNEEAVEIVRNALSQDEPLSPDSVHNEFTKEDGNNDIAKKAARALRDAAYNRGSTDNISAMVIEFKWSDKQLPTHTSPASLEANKINTIQEIQNIINAVNDFEKFKHLQPALKFYKQMLEKEYTRASLKLFSNVLREHFLPLDITSEMVDSYGSQVTLRRLITNLIETLSKDIGKLPS